MKEIYHYNKDGYFLGKSEARENPLEKGSFLIPANATEIEPNQNLFEGGFAKFINNRWVKEDLPIIQEPSAEELLQAAKDKKKVEIEERLAEELMEDTPQTPNIYDSQLELVGKTFKVNVTLHLPLLNTIFAKLNRRIEAGEVNPTRTWGDINGDRIPLNAACYEQLVDHLETRDEISYLSAKIDKDIIDAIEPDESKTIEECIEEIEDIKIKKPKNDKSR